MWPFKKKEIVLKTPIEAYKFTRGGMYLIEYNDRAITHSQVDEIERHASAHSITIKFIRSHGDVVGLYPIEAAPTAVKR